MQPADLTYAACFQLHIMGHPSPVPLLPADDWSKVKDLAQRRKIQNRIAQRNYRNVDQEPSVTAAC